MENPIKMDDWRGYLFLETSISHYLSGFTTIPGQWLENTLGFLEIIIRIRTWLPSKALMQLEAMLQELVAREAARCGVGRVGCSPVGAGLYLVCLMASEPTPM